MMAVLTALALALGGCVSVSAPPATRSFESAAADRGVYPGISMAVANANGVVMAQAYGLATLSGHVAMTPGTQIRMASVSKSLTAAAILMLDQNGKISIDATVATYVPRFSSAGSLITVRQLLNHTSGIQGHAHGDPILHGEGAYPPDVFFAKLNATPLYATPGTSYDYANENYYLLATIVENVSGKSFADFMHENIFLPAGMLSTYSDDGRSNPQLATGYLHRTSSDPFLACPAPDWTQALGGGGIISTPSDIARFDIALLGHKYFDAAHLAMMFAPSVAVGPVSYALGWFVYPQNLIQHQGDFAITTTINAIYPDGTAVVEAGNAGDLAPDFDRTYFTNQLQNTYGTTPFPLGTYNPPSLLNAVGPFSSCDQFNSMFFSASD
jgi:CubicO group peptidase (beta-lactamase class C family)